MRGRAPPRSLRLILGLALLAPAGCVGQGVRYEGSLLQDVLESGRSVSVQVPEDDPLADLVEPPPPVTIEVIQRTGEPTQGRAAIEVSLAVPVNEADGEGPRTSEEVTAWVREHEDPDFDPAAERLAAIRCDLEWLDASGQVLAPTTRRRQRIPLDPAGGGAAAGAEHELTVTAQLATLKPPRPPARVVLTLDSLELAPKDEATDGG